jgi:cleavage and polyadenylation specificity factor subunit 3
MTATQSTSLNTNLATREKDGNLDLLEVTPLGAGSEVGRSCILLKFRGKTILLDCGIHPAYTGLASLPFFDAIENANKIDLLLISQYVLSLYVQEICSLKLN